MNAIGTLAGPAMDIEKHRREVRSRPRDARAHAQLGLALQRAGRLEEAVASQQRALALDARLGDLHEFLADALFHLARYADAAEHYRRATERAPDSARLHQALGETFDRLEQFNEAAASFARAVALAPDDVNALCWLADAQRKATDYQGAVDSYRRVLALEPGHPRAHMDLGFCLYKAGRLDDARSALHAALERQPEQPQLLTQLLMCHLAATGWDDSLEVARRLLAAGPIAPDMHTVALFALSHYCLDPDELTRAHLGFSERWEQPLVALRKPHPNGRDPRRVLRVGFISGDLYSHAITSYLEPVTAILRQSDQLELYAYSNHTVEDAVTARLKGHFRHWRNIMKLDDEAAEKLIREDGIDILIDLSGHTGRNRLPLFARKPAPVQASWFGYGGTTGLSAMDYYITDPFHLPRGRFDDQFSEKIAYLPGGVVFLPDGRAPDVNPLPALRNGHLTFASFHRPNKLSKQVAAQWAQLLHAVPDARLILGGMSREAAAAPLAWLAAEGIGAERITVRERASLAKFMAMHHEVDICLAPFPYTGATTVFCALWMGVPTLATVGATNPSRAVAHPMSHLGLDAFIADNDQAYVQLGTFLSQNLPVLAQLRATMRERYLNSVLGHPPVVAAGLERMLRLMWRRWCAGQPAEVLEVRVGDLATALDEPAPSP